MGTSSSSIDQSPICEKNADNASSSFSDEWRTVAYQCYAQTFNKIDCLDGGQNLDETEFNKTDCFDGGQNLDEAEFDKTDGIDKEHNLYQTDCLEGEHSLNETDGLDGRKDIKLEHEWQCADSHLHRQGWIFVSNKYRVIFLTGPAQKSSKYGTGPTQQWKNDEVHRK